MNRRSLEARIKKLEKRIDDTKKRRESELENMRAFESGELGFTEPPSGITMNAARVLSAFTAYVIENGYSPTGRQLNTILGKSGQSTRMHVKHLFDAGYLGPQDKAYQVYVLSPSCNGVLPEGMDNSPLTFTTPEARAVFIREHCTPIFLKQWDGHEYYTDGFSLSDYIVYPQTEEMILTRKTLEIWSDT